jgi:hypothetical protein
MIAHRVFLTHNPWPELMPDGVLLQRLETAACKASDLWEEWQRAGETKEERDSFAAVLLDPTRPRWVKEISDLVYAIIVFGPDGERFIPNAASKADAHDRHGINMGELVEDFSHCLADGEFADGESAEYDRAIGGGSGLSAEQDGKLVENILINVTSSVALMRDQFINARRLSHGSWRWFSTDDQPDPAYANVVGLLSAKTTLTPQTA